MQKIILDLCGGTGSWSKPYADAGYEVHVITLPKYSVSDIFYDLNTLVFRGQNGYDDLEININDVYGVLAAPPCTMFSMARTTAKTPRDMRTAMETVKACLEIIFACQYEGKRLKFWAMENPKARLRWFMGIPALTFQPFEFGDPHSKKTDIWGNFNTDLKRTPVELDATQRKQSHLNSRELPKIPDDYVMDKRMSRRAVARSITPSGFAQAFFKANKLKCYNYPETKRKGYMTQEEIERLRKQQTGIERGEARSTEGKKCHQCDRPATHTVHHGKNYPVCEGHAQAYMNTTGKEVARAKGLNV